MTNTCTTRQDQLITFVEFLFEPHDILQFVGLASTKQSRIRKWCKAENVVDVLKDLGDYNLSGSIYVGIAPRKETKKAGQKSGAENVLPYRCVCADFDGKDYPDISIEALLQFAQERVEKAGLPRPSMIIFTGHGYHFYWKTDAPIQVEEWVQIEKALAKTLGSDEKIASSTRVMRVPGFVNMKEPGKPIDCALIEVVKDSMYNCETQILPHIQRYMNNTCAEVASSLGNEEVTKKARLCLEYLADTRADDYGQWIQVGLALKTCGCTVDDWIHFSRRSEKFRNGECEEKWQTFNKDPGPKQIGLPRLMENVKDDNGGALPFPEAAWPDANVGIGTSFRLTSNILLSLS